MSATVRRLLRPLLGLALAGLAVPAAAAKTEDPTEALRKSCDKKQGADCLKVADMYTRGEGVPKDPGKAASFLKKGCENGAPRTCPRRSSS
jgi:TPR repeat protein